MRASLDRILELENEDIWIKKQAPETDDEHFLNSDIHMDIWTVLFCHDFIYCNTVISPLEGNIAYLVTF